MSSRLRSGLFWLNRTVDLIFIYDMVTQFRVAYKTVGTNVRWVLEPQKIAFHYVCSKWFWIDLFSILTALFDLFGNEDTKDLVGLRAVRTLRMAKLIRLLRGSRIFKTWEMRLSINYAYMELTLVTVLIMWACHLWACVWGMQATFYPLESWPAGKDYCVPWGDGESEATLRALIANQSCPEPYVDCQVGKCHPVTGCTGGHACVDAWHLYAYSLYFAVMTITSVGYGDVVAMPFNPTEQILCACIMLISGMLWGYLIGTFCGLAAGLSPVIKAFREDLSSLNSFMSEHGLPSETRFRMREYFHQTIHLRKLGVQKVLLENLSPAMQAEISFLVNSRWVEKVWYLEPGLDSRAGSKAASGHGLRMQLAAQLSPFVFPPGEFCPNGFMYIIQRGSALWAGRMLREGDHRRSVWGDDIILYNRDLQILFPALAATYLHVLTIDGDSLNTVIYRFPDVLPHLHKICRRWVVRRAIVREAERRLYSTGRRFRGRLNPIYARELLDAEHREVSGRCGRLSVLTRQRTRFGARISLSEDSSFSSNSSSRSATRRLLRSMTMSPASGGGGGSFGRMRTRRGRPAASPHHTPAATGESAERPMAEAALPKGEALPPPPTATFTMPEPDNQRASYAEACNRRASFAAQGRSLLFFRRANERASQMREMRVAERKRKASVHHAATEFGLDEMKATMQARIADKGATEQRIRRVEEKVDKMMPLLTSIHARLRTVAGAPAPLSDGGGVSAPPVLGGSVPMSAFSC